MLQIMRGFLWKSIQVIDPNFFLSDVATFTELYKEKEIHSQDSGYSC